MEKYYNDFLISDDSGKQQLDDIYEMLHTSYWGKDRSKETIEKSIQNSVCFGIYKNERQIGFARCVTDFATVYWLADVIIDKDYRGQGLGKALVDSIVNQEQLKNLIGILATNNAYTLYEKYGFNLETDRFMSKGPR